MELSTNITTNTITTGTIPVNGNYITTNTITVPTAPSFTPIEINLEDIFFKYDFNNKPKENKKKENKKEEDFTIYSVIEYVPQKVYEIKFTDDTSVKTICGEYDEFDPEYMFYLAIAKKLYSNTLTFDGVLSKTYQLMYEKKYIKMVKQGMKLFKELKKRQKEEEELKEIKERKKQKHIRKKLAAKERKKQEQINIIKQAIILSKEEG